MSVFISRRSVNSKMLTKTAALCVLFIVTVNSIPTPGKLVKNGTKAIDCSEKIYRDREAWKLFVAAGCAVDIPTTVHSVPAKHGEDAKGKPVGGDQVFTR